jgi:PQQ-dependent dehydrogenase (s-GDH family)
VVWLSGRYDFLMTYSVWRAIPLALCLCGGFVFAQNGPESVLRGTKQFRKRVVISGLAGPWEITWGPDNNIWTTERTGKRITRVDPATGEARVAITINEVSAPGGQDGLLGMALHPELLRGTGKDFVYAAYTYVDRSRGVVPAITDPNSEYRYLYMKIVRLQYDKGSSTLSNPMDVITGLPAGNDHDGGRLKFGPDQKLYLTIGDRGHNQLGNFCNPSEAQRLPTQKELDNKDFVAYVGKSLRINLDGSVPKDNAKLAGVVSHVYTYGHRNPQGLDFGPDGTLYSSEHGPKTDDEVNVLRRGGNYGWPNVAGFQDGKAYEFARWAEASTPCSQLTFNDLEIHPSVPREPESAFKPKMEKPLATMFTVPTGFNFADPACKGIHYICWPTVGASSVEYYSNKAGGIPGWDHVLFVTTLKRGSLYVLPLKPNRKEAGGPFRRYFQSENRYRDTAVSPDGKTIFIATDPGGLAESADGGVTRRMADPGAILAFTYEGEGGPEKPDAPRQVSSIKPEVRQGTASADGVPPRFTTAQAAAGKIAYNSSCAVCHGNALTNGTMGTPLAGEYFSNAWGGKTVKAFFDKSRTMPPTAPNSLPASRYAEIVAFILEFNGFSAGPTPLPSDSDALAGMVLK